MDRALFLLCCLAWGRTMAGIMKAMATSFKGICACTVVFRAPDPAAGHPCDAIQPSHPLSSPSPPAPNPSQCSTFSKPGFSNTWTVIFHMFKLVLEKEEEPEIKLPTSARSLKKEESSRKTSISAFWLCQSLWLRGSQETGKFWKRWEYQTTWPASWETYMQVRKQQLELDMEQQTGFK